MSLRHTAVLTALLGVPTIAAAGDAFDRVMVTSDDFAIDLVATGILPDGWPIGRQAHRYLYVDRGGVVSLGTPLDDLPPAPLGALGLPIIAPLWVDAAPADCHPGGAPNAVSRARGVDGLTIRWDGLVAGCGTDAARASFEMTVGPSADGIRITFRFDELRWRAPGLRAYAGLVLGPDAEQQLTLFPDPAADAGKLGELLAARSSDGAPGVWVTEVDGEGRVVGDVDRDGVRGVDNCTDHFNPLQVDTNADGLGDVCDLNDDGDARVDATDNCPLKWNSDQLDWDGDGLGDACDWDDDRDSVPDILDNCRLAPNKGQTDIDHDGLGDACDPDPDGDGLVGEADRCPWVFDPDGGDLDRDGIFDACDLQPKVSCGRLCRAEHLDSDGDGVGDLLDRCPLAPDPHQGDRDGDGRGDACDADMDGDGVLDVLQRGCVDGICPDWSRPATVDFIDFWWLDGE